MQTILPFLSFYWFFGDDERKNDWIPDICQQNSLKIFRKSWSCQAVQWAFWAPQLPSQQTCSSQDLDVHISPWSMILGQLKPRLITDFWSYKFITLITKPGQNNHLPDPRNHYLHCGHSVISGFDLQEEQIKWNWVRQPNIGSLATYYGQKIAKTIFLKWCGNMNATSKQTGHSRLDSFFLIDSSRNFVSCTVWEGSPLCSAAGCL